MSRVWAWESLEKGLWGGGTTRKRMRVTEIRLEAKELGVRRGREGRKVRIRRYEGAVRAGYAAPSEGTICLLRSSQVW